MSEVKPLEQIIMEAIELCTHTRCKKCEYYGEDSAYDYKGKCRGRMIADYLRQNGVVLPVRCKDCKHNVANMDTDPWDDTDYEDIVCLYWMSDGCGPNDFCSRGERRNDG